MASTVTDMVAGIMALRSELPLVPDELKKRIQSIRVRSAQDLQGGSNNWRRPMNNSPQQSQQSHYTSQNRQNYGNANGNGGWRHSNSASSLYSQQSSGSPTANPNSPNPPFRFSSSSPAQQVRPLHRVGSAFQNSQSPMSSPPQTPTGLGMEAPAVPHVPMRYISKFHNGSKTGDDQILNTVILSKLNAFSVKTYDDVKQFLFQILGSDEREFVREFTRLVFRKAAAEDKFCPLFAKLLSEIKKEYPVIMEEMHTLHTTYLDIWNTADSSDSKVDKSYRLGYSQFLAELAALEVLDLEMIKTTISNLKACIVECLTAEAHRETVEEYMDCLKQLCGSKVPKPVRAMIRELLVEDLEAWIAKSAKEYPALSNKSRFACMDLRDLLVK
jgi:hypothetical protein